jgi:hypothetical protein
VTPERWLNQAEKMLENAASEDADCFLKGLKKRF